MAAATAAAAASAAAANASGPTMVGDADMHLGATAGIVPRKSKKREERTCVYFFVLSPESSLCRSPPLRAEGSDTEQSELSSGSGSEAASDRRRQLPSRGVRSQQLWQQVTQLPYTPEAAVQQRAAVLWKVDGSPEWCDATVLEFDCSNGQASTCWCTMYDDDDEEEWHDLREEAVRWPASGMETAPGASWPVQRAAAGEAAHTQWAPAGGQCGPVMRGFVNWYACVSHSWFDVHLARLSSSSDAFVNLCPKVGLMCTFLHSAPELFDICPL